jgi:hypothetical protein
VKASGFSPKATVSMHDGLLVGGFLQAVQRLEAAIADGIEGASDLYIALFEAFNWLDSIDERHGLSGDAHVQALKYVRQRTHHGWAAAAMFDSARSEWVWYRSEILPAPRPSSAKPGLQRTYDRLLAERPVLSVFRKLAKLVGDLDPDRRPS